MTTSGNPDSNIDVCKFVEADDKERLVDLGLVIRNTKV